jgi:hypothetical protein
VLPFLDRLVGDPDAAVVAEAVRFLARICAAGLLRKRHALLVAARLCSRQMLGPAAPTPVRAAAVEFLAAAAGQLSVADVQALLLPLVLPHLAAEPLSFKVRRQQACFQSPKCKPAALGCDLSLEPGIQFGLFSFNLQFAHLFLPPCLPACLRAGSGADHSCAQG